MAPAVQYPSSPAERKISALWCWRRRRDTRLAIA